MLPIYLWPSSCGGGTTMVSMCVPRWMPPASRQSPIHKSWVPPGNVIAALIDLPEAFLASRATLNGAVSIPTFRSEYSLETEMHWPFRLSRARMYIGVGWLFCVTLPDEIRYGIGVRICAPSMPLPSEPSTRLSRVVPHEACFCTSTSGMRYLARIPFSLATND